MDLSYQIMVGGGPMTVHPSLIGIALLSTILVVSAIRGRSHSRSPFSGGMVLGLALSMINRALGTVDDAHLFLGIVFGVTLGWLLMVDEFKLKGVTTIAGFILTVAVFQGWVAVVTLQPVLVALGATILVGVAYQKIREFIEERRPEKV